MGHEAQKGHTHRTQTIIGLSSKKPNPQQVGMSGDRRKSSTYDDDSFGETYYSGSNRYGDRYDEDGDDYSSFAEGGIGKRNSDVDDHGSISKSQFRGSRRYCGRWSKILIATTLLIVCCIAGSVVYMYESDNVPSWISSIFENGEDIVVDTETNPFILMPSSNPVTSISPVALPNKGNSNDPFGPIEPATSPVLVPMPPSSASPGGQEPSPATQTPPTQPPIRLASTKGPQLASKSRPVKTQVPTGSNLSDNIPSKTLTSKPFSSTKGPVKAQKTNAPKSAKSPIGGKSMKEPPSTPTGTKLIKNPTTKVLSKNFPTTTN
mmetsp:Transcript_19681/g.29808  ORF Transcript_19681/g.29808 Transcript_19681/m.29808 type:complete len:320 (+) Transcript_19681:512-1471(+)